MNQLGFLPLILLYAWPASIITKIWGSHIWAKFFRPERPQNIPYEHDDVRSVKRLHACSLSQDIGWHNRPRCDRQDIRKRKRTKEGAFWEVQVNVDSTERDRLLLLIEGGGGWGEKKMECPILFTTPQPTLPPSLLPLFISLRHWLVNNYSLKSRWIVAKNLPSRESGEVNIPKAIIHRD